ncbi:MAG: Holliday junction resolvase RuvX [Acidimicrobiales bacterium]
MRALGLDLGSRRIGVALSDSGGRVATPFTVLERSGDRARDHRRVAQLVAEAEAEAVVVGLPLSLSGSVTAAARAALAEAEELASTVGVAVHTYDERLSTVSAERSLRAQNLRGPARRRVVDQVAAAVMLQAWLDARAAQAPEASSG